MRTQGTLSHQLVTNVRNDSASPKNPAGAAERADGLKRAGAEVSAESPLRHAAERSRGRVREIERSRQAEGANGKPLTHEPSKGQSDSREVHSPARQAMNNTAMTAGAKGANSSDAGANPATQLEAAAAESSRFAVVSKLGSDPVSSTGGSENALARNAAQSVGEQIRDSVQASLGRGEREITIRLRPPELGSVLIRFREDNAQIHGVLEVTRSDTRQEVEQALPQVLRSLQDFGIQIRGFEVTLSDRSDKDAGGQPPSEDARPQQERHHQHARWPEELPGAGPSLEGAEPQDSIEGPGRAAPAGTPRRRIDLLA